MRNFDQMFTSEPAKVSPTEGAPINGDDDAFAKFESAAKE